MAEYRACTALQPVSLRHIPSGLPLPGLWEDSGY